MKNILIVTVLALVISISPSVAEDNYPNQAQIPDCVEGQACSISLKLELLSKLQHDLHDKLHEIDLNCAKENYRACINPEHSTVKEWHRIHIQIGKLMNDLEDGTPSVAKRN